MDAYVDLVEKIYKDRLANPRPPIPRPPAVCAEGGDHDWSRDYEDYIERVNYYTCLKCRARNLIVWEREPSGEWDAIPLCQLGPRRRTPEPPAKPPRRTWWQTLAGFLD